MTRKPESNVHVFKLGHYEAMIFGLALSEYADAHSGIRAETALDFAHVFGTEGVFTVTKEIPKD